ncbi:toxin-antitoxin system YwqK family antitoxin [Adhaeribacter soli]|uniref:Uncharacterized protein n=1 Tax=Adhaeribacter soli TaxID=2607655 RepID=A0A5N1J700_9BACT|nr:hypothetical protein [Adhaeribacter soli]KAA9345893.1 hypothetical protein F0P94_02080 [Adhaeribacter soli]
MIRNTSVLFFFLFASVLNCGSKSKRNQNFYGWYYAPKSDISIDLLPPNIYKLKETKAMDFDNFIEYELSTGTFQKVNNELRLKESKTEKYMSLIISNDEILVAKNVKKLKPKDTLVVGMKYYNNGNKKFQGKWENYRKEYSWQYWDENGNEKYYINFKNGIPIDTVKPRKK